MTDDTTPAGAPDDTGAEMETAEQTIDGLRDEMAQLKEQMLRYAADAENTKRRTQREANDARAFAIQKFAQDMLGAADNLARALQAAPRDSSDPAVKNLVTGIEMIEKDLQTAFERNGLKRIDPPRGTKFDPHQHQAMMEQPASDVGAGAVLRVMQPGYELHGRNVRPAMVIVSAKGSTGETPSEPSSANPYAHPEEGDGAGISLDEKA
jgi:molecular chaperone GrpE